MDDIELITTSDGSHSLRNNRLNETYHSVHGAMQESRYVFLKNGLAHVYGEEQKKNISVLEVGFGTGLNALLTLQFAVENNVYIRYTTLEPFPLSEDIWLKLNYGRQLSAEQEFAALHRSGFNTEVILDPRFIMEKVDKSLFAARLSEQYDVVYFDAFAPNVQPELWERGALEKVVVCMKSGGVFVTYSAKGQLKRDLKDLGLVVETLPGPPGKNEMVRGTKA